MSHELLSGVVINQNQKIASSSDSVSILDSTWRYQDFFLPSDYIRGTNASEQIIPNLTGFQILVGVTDAETAYFDWVLEYKAQGFTWTEITSGSFSGAHATGDKVWVDFLVEEDQYVEISNALVTERFRIGIKGSATSGINKIWLSTPNPQSFANKSARAYTGGGPIQIGGADSSFCFRVLGLTADEGIDFLGNKYRSAVIISDPDNVNTLHGDVYDKIWMSKPNPSRFAVENLYFDIQTSDGLESVIDNVLVDPVTPGIWFSVYYSSDLAQPYQKTSSSRPVSPNSEFDLNVNYWDSYVDPGGTITVFTQVTDDPYAYARVAATTVPDDGSIAINTEELISVQPGDTVNLEGRVNSVITFSGFEESIGVEWFDADLTSLSQEFATPSTSGDGNFHTYNLTTVAPPAAVAMRLWARCVNRSGSARTINLYVDYLRASVTGESVTMEGDWDDKLWTRVPKLFHATKRDHHKLPNPISAKFIKIEFTHLQAQHYATGNFAAPINYKKHPKWVLDYFLTQLATQNASNTLISGNQSIIFDAYDLAYNYYLDDIKQEPDAPVELDPNFTDNLDSFLRDRSSYSDQMDPIMSSKIQTVLTPYINHPVQRGNQDSLLTNMARAASNNNLPVDYPVEYTSTGLFPDVIELRNSQVVFENQYPVMFFYLTCRHRYRELSAPLSHDRAYFAGVREIAFTRDNYSIPHDDNQYTEVGADFTNAEFNDFTSDNGVLVV